MAAAHDRLDEETTTWNNSSNLFWFENKKPMMSEKDRMRPGEDPMEKNIGNSILIEKHENWLPSFEENKHI